jgi:hypothetical protein
MIITDLDGKQSNWKMRRGKAKKSSSLHLYAYELVRSIYPSDNIIEEITIPLTRKSKVFGDIYIPGRRKLIEVHGEQHYNYTPFFYSSKLDFLKAQKRDRDKQEWCEINDIQYVELPYNEKEKWDDLIRGIS